MPRPPRRRSAPVRVFRPADSPDPERGSCSGKWVKLSTPPVIPSARPRYSENEPRVTISGGILPRVMSKPFTLPPSAPRPSVNAAAAPIGSPPSRQSFPKTTAERPMSEPTERSMPPLVITGVSASARRPISTQRRSTSNPFASDAKLVPMTEKTAISSARSAARIACAGSMRSQPAESRADCDRGRSASCHRPSR